MYNDSHSLPPSVLVGGGENNRKVPRKVTVVFYILSINSVGDIRLTSECPSNIKYLLGYLPRVVCIAIVVGVPLLVVVDVGGSVVTVCEFPLTNITANIARSKPRCLISKKMSFPDKFSQSRW